MSTVISFSYRLRVTSGLDWSSRTIHSTGRPSRPFDLFNSSTYTSPAILWSSAVGPRGPVSASVLPIRIGWPAGAAATGSTGASTSRPASITPKKMPARGTFPFPEHRAILIDRDLRGQRAFRSGARRVRGPYATASEESSAALGQFASPYFVATPWQPSTYGKVRLGLPARSRLSGSQLAPVPDQIGPLLPRHRRFVRSARSASARSRARRSAPRPSRPPAPPAASDPSRRR